LSLHKVIVRTKKLYNVESAVLAGKTTRSKEIGLRANVADEGQNLLKINIQIDDYIEDLKTAALYKTKVEADLFAAQLNYKIAVTDR